MKIVPKLYCNLSPQTQEEASLVLARNMKLDNDGNLVSDYGYESIDIGGDKYVILGHIVGLDNLVYLFIEYTNTNNNTKEYFVYEYDEINDTIEPLDIPWTYHMGKITGCVNTNQSGERILTVSEYDCYDGINVPLKHYNLEYDNYHAEQLAVQAPEVPIANLILDNTYAETIPNGVYVFFIRYRIRKDVYTDWFLCSRPVFAGTSETLNTIQGGVKYINIHKDSAKSFKFKLSFVYVDELIDYTRAYKGYQIGFIITHDEATDARVWKDFDLPSDYSISTEQIIYFDYKNVKEANIDDFLKSTYELYDVRNIVTFKNKLYISNYKETNFEPDFIDSTKLATVSSALDIQVVTNEIADSTINATLKISNNIYTLIKYASGVTYYDRGQIGSNTWTISTILGGQNLDNIFTTNVLGTYKTNTRNELEIGIITASFNSDYNPDIYAVNKFTKNTLRDKLLPSALDKSFNANDYSDDPSPSGLSFTNFQKMLYYGLGLFLESNTTNPGILHKASDLGGTNHEFYINGNIAYKHGDIPFAFGSIPGIQGGIKSIRSTTSNWLAYNRGFTEADNTKIDNEFKNSIRAKSCYAIIGIDVISGTKTYPISYATDSGNSSMSNSISAVAYATDANNDNYLGGMILDKDVSYDITNDTNYIESNIILTGLRSSIVGITENGEIVLDANGVKVISNTFIYRIKKYEFDCSIENIDVSEVYKEKNIHITLKTTDYECLVTKYFKPSVLSITDNNLNVEQQSVLSPNTVYDVYAHFVDNHGIVTKGYKLNDTVTVPWNTTNNNNTYYTLKYSLSSSLTSFINAGYKAMFISLNKTETSNYIYLQGFGHKRFSDGTNILYCLELDTLLYNLNDTITVVAVGVGSTDVNSFTAKYYSSGETNPLSAFGNCGFIYWKDDTNRSGKKFYIAIKSPTIDNKTSIKATEYIPLTSTNNAYKEIKDGYYGNWLCKVKKPDYDYCYNIYVSGSDIYNIQRDGVITLEDFKTYYTVFTSTLYYITSPFNLNYLSLTEDINDKLYRIENTNIRQVAKSIPSQNLSYIYELKSMYKDYMNKYFRKVEGNVKTKFDNTIRVSNVLSDETFNNSVFKFEPENYYNIPTNRGVIVKLFAIGNNIFAHAERSLFKFNGNQTIQASEEDINLQESEPFDTGVTEVLDSEYGYGGIANKEAGCVTFDSYFFFDVISRHIFAYGGNSQLQLIDAPIRKLLDLIKPQMCFTLHDANNNRVFFEFYTERNNLTIQYNYKSKSFVSFTDITLDKAFSTIKNCYSYTSWNHDEGYYNYIDYVNRRHSGEHGFPIVKPNFGRLFTGVLDATTYNVISAMCPEYYSSARTYSDIMPANLKNLFGAATYLRSPKTEGYTYIQEASPYSIAVICFPKSAYNEVVNAIKIDSTFNTNTIAENNDDTTINLIDYDVIESDHEQSPIKRVYVQTNSCKSNLVKHRVDAEDKTADAEYKIIKFDKGFWNVNYLRDTLAKARFKDNRYNYNPQEYQNRANADMISDKSSLIYGKYFIICVYFVDYRPVKIENIFINTSNYD